MLPVQRHHPVHLLCNFLDDHLPNSHIHGTPRDEGRVDVRIFCWVAPEYVNVALYRNAFLVSEEIEIAYVHHPPVTAIFQTDELV